MNKCLKISAILVAFAAIVAAASDGPIFTPCNELSASKECFNCCSELGFRKAIFNTNEKCSCSIPGPKGPKKSPIDLYDVCPDAKDATECEACCFKKNFGVAVKDSAGCHCGAPQLKGQ